MTGVHRRWRFVLPALIALLVVAVVVGVAVGSVDISPATTLRLVAWKLLGRPKPKPRPWELKSQLPFGTALEGSGQVPKADSWALIPRPLPHQPVEAAAPVFT